MGILTRIHLLPALAELTGQDHALTANRNLPRIRSHPKSSRVLLEDRTSVSVAGHTSHSASSPSSPAETRIGCKSERTERGT